MENEKAVVEPKQSLKIFDELTILRDSNPKPTKAQKKEIEVLERKFDQLTTPLTNEEIPQLVGQIASLVKAHFQDQIDGLVNKMNTYEELVEGLKALSNENRKNIMRVDGFSEKIFDQFITHTHK